MFHGLRGFQLVSCLQHLWSQPSKLALYPTRTLLLVGCMLLMCGFSQASHCVGHIWSDPVRHPTWTCRKKAPGSGILPVSFWRVFMAAWAGRLRQNVAREPRTMVRVLNSPAPKPFSNRPELVFKRPELVFQMLGMKHQPKGKLTITRAKMGNSSDPSLKVKHLVGEIRKPTTKQ